MDGIKAFEFKLRVMTELLAFLDAHSGALLALFSAVVMVATVVYAILTAALVRETRRMREVQTEPRIEVVAEPKEEYISIITLLVRNIGAGPAYDVRFSIRGESASEGEAALIADFTRSRFLLTGLKYLGPGQHIRSSYTQMNKDHDKKMSARLLVTVEYSSALGRSYRDVLSIDFEEFKGYGRVGKPHLYAIAQSLAMIDRHVGWLATGFKKLGVNVYSAKDREQERQEMEEIMEEVRKESD